MHVVVYLPFFFYAGIASTIVETLQAVNEVSGDEVFSFEFVAKHPQVKSKSGITFMASRRPSRKMDVLILLAGLRPDAGATLRLLERESKRVRPLIELAQEQEAIIATTCAAAYLLAATGLLNGKRATISWWLRKEAQLRFPQVRWEPSRLLVRQGRLYTTGAAFAGLELITRLLLDLGFKKEERLVRKLMLLPPSRQLQSPYELPERASLDPFEMTLSKVAHHNMQKLNLKYLAQKVGTSERSLSRRFCNDLRTSPGKWIQQKRLDAARALLESTKLNIAEICFRVGYQDVASFSRLFSKTTGMTPGEFRRQLQS